MMRNVLPFAPAASRQPAATGPSQAAVEIATLLGKAHDPSFIIEIDCEIGNAAFSHAVDEWVGDYREIAKALKKRAKQLRKIVTMLETLGPPADAVSGAVTQYAPRMTPGDIVRSAYWQDRNGFADAIRKLLAEASWAEETTEKLSGRKKRHGRKGQRDERLFHVLRILAKILHRHEIDIIPGDEKIAPPTVFHKAALKFVSAISYKLRSTASSQHKHGYLIHVADELDGFEQMSHRMRVERLRLVGTAI